MLCVFKIIFTKIYIEGQKCTAYALHLELHTKFIDITLFHKISNVHPINWGIQPIFENRPIINRTKIESYMVIFSGQVTLYIDGVFVN